MLSLGDIHVTAEEVIEISGRGQEIRLRLRWPWTDLPILWTMPTETEIRFDHLPDQDTGVPVRIRRWSARSRISGGAAIRLALQLPAG